MREEAGAVPLADYQFYTDEFHGTEEGQLLPGEEKVGQIVELQSLGGRTLTGPIQRLTIDLAGGYLMQMTLRGA